MNLISLLARRKRAHERSTSIGDTPPNPVRDSNLTEDQLSMLQTPTAARSVPVKMNSMGGVIIYVSDEKVARNLAASDRASVATTEAIRRHR